MESPAPHSEDTDDVDADLLLQPSVMLPHLRLEMRTIFAALAVSCKELCVCKMPSNLWAHIFNRQYLDCSSPEDSQPFAREFRVGSGGIEDSVPKTFRVDWQVIATVTRETLV